MAITSELVKTLREKTGVGMMDCKAALTETEGDLEKAIDVLRKRGLAAAAKRAGRTAAQGIVEAYIHLGGKIGVLLEVNCETDFVARNIEFHSLVRDLAMQVAATSPQYIFREEVPEGIIQHEREIISSQADLAGKPPKVVEQIVNGRLENFYRETCLLEQSFIKDLKKTVKELVAEQASKFGENIVVRRFARFQVGEKT